MAKYLVLFSVTSETLRQFIENPEDRRAPASKLGELAGGKLDSYYWMFGQYDGLAIYDLPDSAAAGALSLAAASTGAFKQVETHELLAADDLVGVLQQAKTLRPGYRPPGRSPV
jgi:uncharacterized protein with GYD domain